jgi:long-chain acyl-CoA synthetase
MNLGNLVGISTARNPHKAAVIFGNENFSYEQLDQATASLARWFIEQGCQPGDRIALHWPNSIEMVKLLFACFKAGLIAVPVNVLMKAPEVAYTLMHSKAVMCFVRPDRLAVVEEAAHGCTTLRAIHTFFVVPDERQDRRALPAVKEDDPALILYTSGTTARPKGVTHTHRSILEMVKLAHDMVPSTIETTLLMTQMTYISAIGGCLLPAMWDDNYRAEL